MIIEVKVPGVGESIEGGVLVEWLKGEGELVRRDDPLFVLETDKVTLTVNSTHTGWLTKYAKVNEEVKIGQTIAVIDTSSEKDATLKIPAGAEKEDTSSLPLPRPVPLLPDKIQSGPASPVVRRLMDENDIVNGSIKGTGKNGRITKDDVLRKLGKNIDEQEEGSKAIDYGRQTRRPVSPIRARIAERLLLGQNSTAQLTTFVEADLTDLVAARELHRQSFETKHGVPLTYLPFFVKAVVEGLKKVRPLATFMAGGELVENNYFDIGIAISAEQGLVVPVLREADRKTIPEIQKEISEMSAKVRGKKISLDELQGGVFTITNAGSYGGLFGTPVLNPPQSGVLGVYVIEDRPRVMGGLIEARKMCYLALTYDHRVVDGKEAGAFLKTVSRFMETQAASLLEG